MARCKAMAGLLVASAILALATSVAGADIAALGVTPSAVACPPGQAMKNNGACVPEYNPLVNFTATYSAIVKGRELVIRQIKLQDFPLGDDLNNARKIQFSLPEGPNLIKVRFTADTRRSPYAFTGVRCLVTTNTSLITSAQKDPIFYSLATSSCYTCQKSTPKLVSSRSGRRYSPATCGCSPPYNIVLNKERLRTASLQMGTAWMTVYVQADGKTYSPTFPFPLCLLTFSGQVGIDWVPTLPGRP